MMTGWQKKLDTRGLRHRHSTTDCFTVNFSNLAFPLVYEFSNVLSEKRKRDTSAKEMGVGGELHKPLRKPPCHSQGF